MKDYLRIRIVVTGALLTLVVVGLVVVSCTTAGPAATTAPTTPP